MQRCRNCNKIIGVGYYDAFCDEECEIEYVTSQVAGHFITELTPNDIIEQYEFDKVVEQLQKGLGGKEALMEELGKELSSPSEKINSRFEILDL